MKLGGNLPPGHYALLFSISGTESFICPVAQTRLNIPRPLQGWIQEFLRGGGDRNFQTDNAKKAGGGGVRVPEKAGP